MKTFDLDSLWNGNERIIPDLAQCARSVPAHFARYQFARTYLWAAQATSVIDWGCGVGYGAEILKDANLSYVGVEIRKAAVEYARARYGQFGRFMCANIFETDLAGDVGLCFELLEHLPDAPAEAVSRLLERTPKLVFSVPYQEVDGNNPHHLHFGLSEESFADLVPDADVLWRYQDFDGVVHQDKIATVKNLIGIAECFSNGDYL